MALRGALRFSCGLSRLLSQRLPCSSHVGGRISPFLTTQQRNNSTTAKVKVDFDQSTGVALMSMQSPPVNSLSLEFLTELSIAVEKLEMDKSCRGIILTSGQPKVFSAGLDIMEMYGKSPEHCGEFWRAVQEIWLKLYGSNMVVIAAINGSSPAGGCLLSLTCDYRIMADNPRYSIGLNETQLGIVAPFWFRDTMMNTVGHRSTEIALQLGQLYSPAEALETGLVDKLVPERPGPCHSHTGNDQMVGHSRPRQTTNQVHGEEADRRQVNVQQRIRHPELRQFHHQRLHPEVSGHVPGNA
ncbi:unnamed protein product [Tetraodon nigroviridis]|uniref:Enoyl-CoA delta isomerase 1, mitochondrial n=1 Tax=Tetraodon nigroviridis TaxID=99883 RepID=Q4SBB3_TETNG|nr:unnamed protein product [Tetraodon nigroviridis]